MQPVISLIFGDFADDSSPLAVPITMEMESLSLDCRRIVVPGLILGRSSIRLPALVVRRPFSRVRLSLITSPAALIPPPMTARFTGDYETTFSSGLIIRDISVKSLPVGECPSILRFLSPVTGNSLEYMGLSSSLYQAVLERSGSLLGCRRLLEVVVSGSSGF